MVLHLDWKATRKPFYASAGQFTTNINKEDSILQSPKI